MAIYECSEHGYIGKNQTTLFAHLSKDHGLTVGAHNGIYNRHRNPRYFCNGGTHGEGQEERFKSLPIFLSHLNKEHNILIIVEKGISKKRVICPDTDVRCERYRTLMS
jgi:hypothetical protein